MLKLSLFQMLTCLIILIFPLICHPSCPKSQQYQKQTHSIQSKHFIILRALTLFVVVLLMWYKCFREVVLF